MRFYKVKYFFISLMFLILGACKQQSESKEKKSTHEIKPKYAKGFVIEQHDKYNKVTIFKPYKGASQSLEYFLIKKDTLIVPKNEFQVIVQLPIQKIVATSTTQIPVIEALESVDLLKGFPNTNFVSSEKTRSFIDGGKITDLGSDQNLNTELVLNIKPDAFFAFAVNGFNKTYKTLKKMQIPVVIDGSWLEETALGRAEWIKFFAAFLEKEALAEKVFLEIEQNYLTAKTLANNVKKKPTVMYGSTFQGTWYTPAGDSFMAEILEDAQVNYLWKDTKGVGSLSLNFEAVYAIAQKADLWLSPGHAIDKNQLERDNPHYTQFLPFQHDKIYSYNNTKGATGGTIYYELGALRPDYILKDFVKIAHPELLPNYKCKFYKKLQ